MENPNFLQSEELGDELSLKPSLVQGNGNFNHLHEAMEEKFYSPGVKTSIPQMIQTPSSHSLNSSKNMSFNYSDDDEDDEDDDDDEEDEDDNSPQKTSSLYSGFDEMVSKRPYQTIMNSSSFSNQSNDVEPEENSLRKNDVSNHLKGALSFGLANNKNAMKPTIKKSDSHPSLKPHSSSHGGGGGLLVHHPVVPRRKETDNIDHLNDDLQHGYRILCELMSDYQKATNIPFMDAIELDVAKNRDYLEVIEKPIWLKKIKEVLLKNEYDTITDLVAAIRLMLENTYTYHGPFHTITKKGIRLEHMLEQKLALLPKELKELCTLERTSGEPVEEPKETHRNKSAKLSVNGHNFFSHILYKARGRKALREKEIKRRKMEHMRAAKLNKELEILQWEEDLLAEPIKDHMKSMWELPQIGHFIYLILKTLNINEVPQYELERMLLIPQASSTLKMLMTSLLSSPQNRLKLNEKPFMPYKTWARKLASKTVVWYRCYYRENKNVVKVFDQIGIEPQFWKICGETNPFDTFLFHEMTFHQRVWLLKAMCDFLVNSHKTILDVLMDQSEPDLRECTLGMDRDGNKYVHFPQFCGQDLRIYRWTKPTSNDFVGRELDAIKDESVVLFPKEVLKEHRKKMKRIKKDREKDRDWSSSHKSKKKKGKKRKYREPEEETVAEFRSRPGNLRQRPRASYKDDLDDLGISSEDEEDRVAFKSRHKKKKKKKKKKEERESESESEDEVPPERTTSPVMASSDQEASNLSTPSTELTRAQQKNPRIRKAGKKKMICDVCQKSFNSHAALKGHRAIHTKEKLKMMQSRESTPTPVPAEKESDGEDKNIEGNLSIKQENKENSKDSDEVAIDNCDDKSSCDISLSSKNNLETESSCNSLKANCHDKDNDNPVKEEAPFDDVTVKMEELSDNENLTNVPEDKFEVKTECVKKEEPEDEVETHDPSPYAPNPKDFWTVVTNVEELRSLIKKFGELPKPIKEKNKDNKVDEVKEDEEEEEEEEEEEMEEKSMDEPIPKCERKLHAALCKLLTELSPWEARLLQATKKMRNKIRNEQLDFLRKGEHYVDPHEEVWASDPEPEPEPPQATPAEPSSSSSSSEESLDEEGNPKRKLRRRRVKRSVHTPTIAEAAATPQVPAPGEENTETIAVSSRGRVRKVKRIINYDTLDFDKLASQAKQEAQIEKERKKRKREDAWMDTEQNGDTESAPVGGIKKYILSTNGQVMGYIDHGGQVHSGSLLKDSHLIKDKTNSHAIAPKPSIPTTSTTNISSNKQPTVVVAAINDHGSPVYVRVVGNQAMLLLKYMKPPKGPISQVKLHHDGQTYTVNSNAHMSYANIPGLEDQDSANILNTSSKTSSTNNLTPSSSPRPISSNFGRIGTSQKPLLRPNLSSPHIVSSLNNSPKPYCSTPNTVALAYRGIPSTNISQQTPQISRVDNTSSSATLTSTTNLVSAIPSLVSSVSPYQTTSKKINIEHTPNSASAVNVLNSPIMTQTIAPKHIIPKNVSSVISPSLNAQPSNIIQVVNSNVAQNTIVKLDKSPKKSVAQVVNNQQMQVKLGSDSLVQLIQKAGNKIVAVPNGKGGYTLSMTPIGSVPENTSPQNKNISIQMNKPENLQNVIITSSVQNSLTSQSQPINIISQPAPVHTIVQQIESPKQEVVPQNTFMQPQVKMQESFSNAVPVSEMQGSPQTRYILQPQILNQGIAPNISQNHASMTASSQVSAAGSNHLQTTQIATSQQKNVIVGSSMITQQKTVSTGIQQQYNSSTGSLPLQRVLINQQGQQILRVASNSIIQQPTQVVRLQQPLGVAGGHKLLQMVQPSGRQVIQMIHMNNANQTQQINPQTILNSSTSVDPSTHQTLQFTTNSNITQKQLASVSSVSQAQQSGTVQTIRTQVQAQPQIRQQKIQQITHTQIQPSPQNQMQTAQQIQIQSSPQTQIQNHTQQQIQIQSSPHTQIQPTQQIQIQSTPQTQIQQTQQLQIQPTLQIQSTPQTQIQQTLQIQSTQQTQIQQTQQIQIQSSPQTQIQQAQQIQIQPSPQNQSQPTQQPAQSRLVFLRTNQGEKIGLQLPDGRLTILNQEQLQAYNVKTSIQ